MPESMLNKGVVSKPIENNCGTETVVLGNEDILLSKILSLHRPIHYIESCSAKSKQMKSKENLNAILMNNRYNKATAFTPYEREALGLTGLLPPVVETMDIQLKRAYKQLFRFTVPLSQHIYLSSLRERNETLFYRLIIEHLEEIMPLIYTPTVGEACLEYGLQFRQAEGMYISIQEKGKVKQILNNWKPNVLNEIAIIVVTDGSRILGLGDLGACGMGIPIGKLALYVAAAGFHPSTTLPVLLDVGTDNKKLREDEFYLGLRQPRVSDDSYYELIEEFMTSVHEQWPNALVQFEDFSNNHCFTILEKYCQRFLCFNDDIQGTGAVIAAGFLNALKIAGLNPSQCKVLFVGAGSAGVGVASQMIRCMALTFKVSPEECRDLFYMVDSAGLVTSDRQKNLQSFKVPFARADIKEKDVAQKTLFEIVKLIKPNALIGLSGQPNQFTKEIIQFVSTYSEKPIIFPLSNPTSKAECTYQDAFDGSNGKCIFASGSPFAPIHFNNQVYEASQGNNLYAFPGLGFGAWLSHSKMVTENMVTATSIALANSVTEEDLRRGRLYPPLSNVRETSAIVASAVMQTAYKDNVSQLIQQPTNYLEFVKSNTYFPEYYKDVVLTQQ